MARLSAARTSSGRTFHKEGATVSNDCSPIFLFDRRETRVSWSADDRSWRDGTYTVVISSRYLGARWFRHLYTNTNMRNQILRWTGSQWSSRSIGVIWTDRGVLVITRAARFCKRCRRSILIFESPGELFERILTRVQFLYMLCLNIFLKSYKKV